MLYLSQEHLQQLLATKSRSFKHFFKWKHKRYEQLGGQLHKTLDRPEQEMPHIEHGTDVPWKALNFSLYPTIAAREKSRSKNRDAKPTRSVRVHGAALEISRPGMEHHQSTGNSWQSSRTHNTFFSNSSRELWKPKQREVHGKWP